jgi:hypothetical protein
MLSATGACCCNVPMIVSTCALWSAIANPTVIKPQSGPRMSVCPYCNRPLMSIDYYGDVLIGCVDCNRWGRPDDKTLVMELLEDALEAVRATVKPSQS